MENAHNQPANPVAQGIRIFLIWTMENIDLDHNVSLVPGEMKGATHDTIMSMVDDGEVREAVNPAIIRILTSASMVQDILKDRILNENIVKPVALLVNTRVEKDFSEVAPLSVVIALPSLSP